MRRALAVAGLLLSASAWAQGAARPVTPGQTVELGPNSTVYINTDGNTIKIANGQEVGLSPGATVALDGATQFALTGGVCTVTHGATWLSVGTGVTVVAPIPLQTGVTVTNRDPTRYMACTCDDSTPTAPGHGEWLAPDGGSLKCPINDSTSVKCVANTAGGAANLIHTHESCAQGSPFSPLRPQASSPNAVDSVVLAVLAGQEVSP